ncbi:hypothetical protein V6N13_078975 [Hibiscus sabdariffa]|uniref:Peptidase C14 caspase domain-containing protein n=1 Tax=Hibiscus sabdariffa TaxID=183260 RepID=A0ABR2RQ45_9ROSI
MAAEGKKRAVLVGCNYPYYPQFRLHGCINDVLEMEKVLVDSFGFDSDNVKVLTDAPGSPSKKLPTFANIMAALTEMVEEAEAGDVLFFHFSGHGTTISNLEPGQPYRENEAIVPCDLNIIADTDLRNLIQKLKSGTSFTILSDSCHSGGLIDKDKEQIGPSTLRGMPHPNYCKARGLSIGSIFQTLQSVAATISSGASHIGEIAATGANILQGFGSVLTGIHGARGVSIEFQPQHERGVKSLTENEGILLSGCEAKETSADGVIGGKAHGAFTYAVLQALKHCKGFKLSNKELVTIVRRVLQEHGFKQHPCLYCSDENVDAPFLATKNPNEEKTIWCPPPYYPGLFPPPIFPGLPTHYPWSILS